MTCNRIQRIPKEEFVVKCCYHMYEKKAQVGWNLIQNEQNIKFWEDYLRNLNELDLNAYSDKLTVPVLVPIGNRIFFRGSIKHTNEVLVPLGADYFTKCSVKQAEILRQHRIKDAKQKLEAYNKEKEYLESQMSFSKENTCGNSGQEIIEVVSEEEDKAWREQHKIRLKHYHQNKGKEETEDSIKDIPDEDIWLRLEELELQEEMQNELDDMAIKTDNDESDYSSYDSFIIKEDDVSNIQTEELNQSNIIENSHITHNFPEQTSKIDLLQQIIDRQKMLEVKLTKLKNRERNNCKSYNDLINRLDEIEQWEELEDEMDRLGDTLGQYDHEDDNANNKTSALEISEKKRSVSFEWSKDDAETLKITFVHSDIEPCTESYRPEQGINKPSDIYEAYSHLLTNKITSILKKSKYKDTILHDQINNNVLEVDNIIPENLPVLPLTQSDVNVNRTILINDIIEKTDDKEIKLESDKRPVSLFKKRRQQEKS